VRFATLRDGSRDGMLLLVARSGERAVDASSIAPNLQAALDAWELLQPDFRALAERLEADATLGAPLDPRHLCAPLPRAYEWIDASSFLNHVRLVRRARNSSPPEALESDPLVYQGGSGVLLGPTDDLKLPEPAWGLDFEAEICAVLGDVPIGTRASEAERYVRLFLLANDLTYRNLVSPELKKGFGFFQSKPATSFAPFAITPDELGGTFHDGRVWLRMRSVHNGELVGDVEAGRGMHFSFFDLIEHVSETRAFTAGTILGSGTVSSEDRTQGVSCLVERRALETIDFGAPTTAYLNKGDRIRIEMFDEQGKSLFGAIDQRVTG
jgi:fumarylacetoacetate (FAA) hydrolase